MTAATLQSSPLFSAVSSSTDAMFPILSVPQQVEFSWSDFPVVHQYNEDMPAPPTPSSTPVQYVSSVSPASVVDATGCSKWETVSDEDDTFDDDTTSFSISSDEETIGAFSSSEEKPKKDNDDGPRKSVKFSDVLEIRSHAVVLGSHPCSSGLALELGWEAQELELVDFDLYESSRKFQRRHLHQLRLTYWERRRLLELATGLSEQELLLQEQRAWREQIWPSETQKTSRDKAPVVPRKSCPQEVTALESSSTSASLKKVTSSKTLSILTTQA